MRIALGADHAGIHLKQEIRQLLDERGFAYSDFGTNATDSVDYPDFAKIKDTDFAPGPETIEAELFREDQIPWDQLAFRTVRATLEYFFEDRRKGSFDVHSADIG